MKEKTERVCCSLHDAMRGSPLLVVCERPDLVVVNLNGGCSISILD